ncbi:hypothetical protein SAMN04488490_0025 [Marinobacter sp. LV10R510-11A]|nr:hypothetical protein SAMN04488490_0025 [Marinobacter sp. LV10R510-11A]
MKPLPRIQGGSAEDGHSLNCRHEKWLLIQYRTMPNPLLLSKE